MDITEVFLKFALLGAGWVLWLLVGLSVASIAVMIERAVFFLRGRIDLGAAAGKLRSDLASGGSGKARKEIEGRIGAPEVRILIAGMDREQGGPEAVEAAIGARRAVEKIAMERGLSYLGPLGPISPFIGLFGTVLGIVGAFNNLSLNTQGGIGVVMANLSEALVATAVGLLVAIPAVVLYNVFMRMAQGRLTGATVLTNLYLSWLHGERAGGGAGRP